MNKIDILFIVDITGSMGHFVSDAQKQMQNILKDLSEKYHVDLKAGLSLYRDHPDQGDPIVTLTFDLMTADEIKSKIDQISVGGGGDVSEAVLDGVIDGISSMSWRDGSKRIAFLIGDAPGHGLLKGDPCCTCGRTWGEAVAVAEENRVSIYSIQLDKSTDTYESFKVLSSFTGGMLITTDKAMDVILSTLDKEIQDIDLGSKILEMLSKEMTPEDISKILNIDREKVSELEVKISS